MWLQKTKKENDEEERSREQKLKLAELMKGILNGQGGAEVATAMVLYLSLAIGVF